MIDSYRVISWVGIISAEVLLVPPARAAGAGQDVQGSAGVGGAWCPAQKGLRRSRAASRGKELSPCSETLGCVALRECFLAGVLHPGA